MLGMSSKEWPVYVVEQLGARLTPDEVNAAVVEAMLAGYREHLPLLPGAREAVERLSQTHTLGLASSSNRPVIDVVLETMGVRHRFAATVSSEEVARGKPAPDVYLEAAHRLGADPDRTAAIEDSHNGIRAAKAAGMRVVAIPNLHYPPDPDALAQADLTLGSLTELSPATLA
jgi:HAD superfamily hydrolase (TIGR01509 family)